MNDRNPYAPPNVDVEDVRASVAAPPLWNPNAAASWSLLLSPIFGAMLHMKNWQALGEPQRAASSRAWVIVSTIFFVILSLLSFAWPDSKMVDGLGRLGALALLLSWYFASAKAQQKYVIEKFGPAYPRRGWGKPLLFALLVFLGYLGAVFVIAFVFALVTGAS